MSDHNYLKDVKYLGIFLMILLLFTFPLGMVAYGSNHGPGGGPDPNPGDGCPPSGSCCPGGGGGGSGAGGAGGGGKGDCNSKSRFPSSSGGIVSGNSMAVVNNFPGQGPSQGCPNTPNAPNADGPSCCPSSSNAGPGTTPNPILLMRGSVVENEVDLSLPGPLGGWKHRRAYDSLLNTLTSTNMNRNIQGRRWTSQSQILCLRKINGGTQLELTFDSSLMRTFTPNQNGTFTTDADFNGTLTRSNSQGYIVYTLIYPSTQDVYIFREKDPRDPCWGITGYEGDYIRLYERTNLTYYTEGIPGERYFYNSAGKVILTVTAAPQSYGIVYNYLTTGSAAGCLRSIEVYDSIPVSAGGTNQNATKIAEVEYYYHGQDTTLSDVGYAGDLVQVRVSKLMSDKTTWDHKYTQYRYYNYNMNYGYYSQLKYVFESDAIERIMANNTGLSSPSALLSLSDSSTLSSGNSLKAYASKEFTHYTDELDTYSTITTCWGNENLRTKYGGLDRAEIIGNPEFGMVKSETIRTGCASCGGSTNGGLKMTYYYMIVNPITTTDLNAVVYMVVEDTQDSNNTPVSRTIYGLNVHGVELRIIKVKDPSATTLETVCTSRILDSRGMIAEIRSAEAHEKVTTNALITQFMNPYNPTTSSWANDTATLENARGII